MMRVESPDFKNLENIPPRYTVKGEEISPSLVWDDLPEGTRSLLVFCHDPDAPIVKDGGYGFVHWSVYNIPMSVTGLDVGDERFTHGLNDAGIEGYMGPYPPSGHGPHHYYFVVMALDGLLSLEPSLTLWELLSRVEGRVLDVARTVGIYER